MKKNIISILLCTVFLYLVGCEDNPVTISNTVNKYAPYKVGAFWVYERSKAGDIKYYYSEEVISKEYERKYKVIDTHTFVDTANVDTVYIIDTNYIRITDRGIISSPPDGMEVYILKEPFETGNTWSYESIDSLIYTFEIVEDNLSFETPAGKFNSCLKINLWDTNNSRLLWEVIFAPYVGMVAFDSYNLIAYKIP